MMLAGGSPPAARAIDASSGDPVVTAVGDMACDPSDPSFKGGAGTSSRCAEARVSAAMAAETDVDGMLGLGDYQYSCDDPNDFAVSYTPTWGVMNPFITPAAGNHEYQTGTDAYGAACPSTNTTAQDYFSYFANSGSNWAGGGSHQATAGHFSYDIGSWHIIALNANCGKSGVGGCGASSSQTKWLASDLSSTAQPCILAYWHQPRWTGQSKNSSATSAWWSLLYQHHADLVLNGHLHNYQRFAQVNASGQPDANGVREVIVGTGGASLQGFSSTANPMATVRLKKFGYLRLVLHPSGYDGTFILPSGSIADSFSATCH
jgi:Calcineurin-like phosphoesterase